RSVARTRVGVRGSRAQNHAAAASSAKGTLLATRTIFFQKPARTFSSLRAIVAGNWCFGSRRSVSAPSASGFPRDKGISLPLKRGSAAPARQWHQDGARDAALQAKATLRQWCGEALRGQMACFLAIFGSLFAHRIC